MTQATQELGVANAAVRAAIGERRPAVSLRSDYGLVSYPNSAPTFRDWRTNWTVGVGVSMPILTGGRLQADEASARAEVVASQARVRLAKELSALDNDSVRLQLLAAHANWQASGATIEQAGRAYKIADLRFREGLSTQLELSDARLLLARAQVTRAVAARDLQVQRVQFALLPELPLGGLAVSASGGGVATANTQSAARGDADDRWTSGGDDGGGRCGPDGRSGRTVVMHGKSTSRRHGLAAGLGLMALVVSVAGCGKGEPGAAAAEVAAPAIEIGRENIVTVATGDISVGPLISGELRAQREANVRAEIGGAVLSVFAEEGQAVKQGALLARIESRTQEDAYRSAQSMVHSAEESLALAERELARTERLVKAGALAERDLESARTRRRAFARSATTREREPCRRRNHSMMRRYARRSRAWLPASE